jgi:hypothetical protein
MDHFGFIHEKLDIKILILFILRRLPGTVEPSTLGDLCRQCDDGVGYFDYSDCLGELMLSGHVVGEDEEYAITDKGLRNSREVESSLPFSVRSKALRLIAPVEERLARAAMIRTDSVTDEEGCHVRLAMSDGKGEIISMSLLCAGEEQAKTMKKTFRRSAEEIYQRIVEILCEEGK